MSCIDCFSGTLHEGHTHGTETTLHGLDVYTTGPAWPAAQGIVVILPDIFGWKMPNTRLWADRVAMKGGWRVLLPEFMHGHAADASYLPTAGNLFRWPRGVWDVLAKPYYAYEMLRGYTDAAIHTRTAVCYPRIASFLASLRTDPETSHLPLGVAGFCWGGLHAIRLAHTDAMYMSPTSRDTSEADKRPLVDAAFLAHPQPLNFPSDMESVARPVSVAVGTKDWCIGLAQVEDMKRLLDNKSQESGVPTEVVVYPGAGHGFAVRFDPDNGNLAKQADDAEEQAVAWFKRHLIQ